MYARASFCRAAQRAGLFLCFVTAIVLASASAALALAVPGTAPSLVAAPALSGDAIFHVLARTDTCAPCHMGGDLTAVHLRSGCDSCHNSTDPKVVAAFNTGVRTCAACHPKDGVDYHQTFVPAHTFAGMSVTCQAAGCHANSLTAAHAALVGPTGVYPQYPDTCALCHRNQDPARVPAGATAACSSCHASVDHASVHLVARTDGCASCHAGADLIAVHAGKGCAVCHGSADPKVTGAIAAGQKACGVCHSQVSHESLHVATVPPDCEGCHPGTSLTTIHVARGCGGCHDSTDVRVTSAIAAHQTACAGCHDGHADLAVAHTVAPFAGALTLTDHGTLYVQCSMCHASADIRAVHNNDCSTCHSAGGPLSTFATWSKTCQQGACHRMIHASAVPSHASFECAECHLGGGYDAASISKYCGECHVLVDVVAPVTSSDVRASYNGPAAIRLTASDAPDPGGSGVAHTYYAVDGAARAEGTAPVVAGNGTHSLEFWSVDGAGNAEAPHTVVTFVVASDTTPPATTVQGVSAGVNYLAARAIQLAATDDGAVADTFYQISPGGVVKRGVSLTAPLPPAPGQTVSYTLAYWSIDRSGNQEAHRSITFSITNPAAGNVGVNVYNDLTETEAAGQAVWVTDAAGAEVARGMTDVAGNWTALVPFGSGYVAHTSSAYTTPFSSQAVPALSTGRPQASVWLMTMHP